MKFICPLITVADIKKSREFYEKVLEQKVKFDFGENVTFEGDFAIHKKSHFQKLIDNKEIKTNCNNFELYFEYDNLQQLENKLSEIKVDFVHELREQPWRQKVIRFYDLDKNIIEVGESMEFLAYRLTKEGNTLKEISEIISMPLELVKASIQKLELKNYQGRVPACGCFCGGCPTYTREKKPCPGAEINYARCENCKTFHLCCKDKGVSYCYQCDEFPCKKFKSWTKRWEKYGQNFIENQNILKLKGQNGFLEYYNSKINITE
ncbi:MAG: hypothetical protein JEZ09_03870 [Salinivirgaceae bacterium]|nr:hypothetical protein [Salinivirgaceae bacterium]